MQLFPELKLRHLPILVLLFFITTVYKSAAQTSPDIFSISGVVTDEKGETMPGATVFLADSRKATATDNEGKFIFDDLHPGVYEVVVKMMGFEVYNQSVILQTASAVLVIKLKINTIVLKEVNITPVSGEEQKMYMELFTGYFISISENAQQCKLLNPEVIDFYYDKTTATLEASSEQFIVVENKALGYRVHYLLKAFSFDLRKRSLFYDGSSYFEELEGTPSQQKKWDKNRQLAYLGSKWHFFKAAFNNRLKEEGFVLYRLTNRPLLMKYKQSLDKNYLVPFTRTDLLFTRLNENLMSLNLHQLKNDSTMLYVVYTKTSEPYEYTHAGRHIKVPGISYSKFGQTSAINPREDRMLIDKSGNADPKNGIRYAGYWTFNMISGFLPPNYEVPVKKSIPKKR